MVASGYKAGISSFHFPTAARDGFGISTAWLLANWTTWYAAKLPDAIFVAPEGYRLARGG